MVIKCYDTYRAFEAFPREAETAVNTSQVNLVSHLSRSEPRTMKWKARTLPLCNVLKLVHAFKTDYPKKLVGRKTRHVLMRRFFSAREKKRFTAKKKNLKQVIISFPSNCAMKANLKRTKKAIFSTSPPCLKFLKLPASVCECERERERER